MGTTTNLWHPSAPWSSPYVFRQCRWKFKCPLLALKKEYSPQYRYDVIIFERAQVQESYTRTLFGKVFQGFFIPSLYWDVATEQHRRYHGSSLASWSPAIFKSLFFHIFIFWCSKKVESSWDSVTDPVQLACVPSSWLHILFAYVERPRFDWAALNHFTWKSGPTSSVSNHCRNR